MQLRNFVGGVYVESAASAFTGVVDPSTGQAYARVGRATSTGRSRLPSRGSRPGETSPRATGSGRCCGSLARWRRAQVARGELPHILDCLEFFAGAARRLDGIAAGEYVAGHTSMLRREPLGVVAAVTPWNYPLMMAVWKVTPALAAGNAVVLKPAETTPVTPLMLAELAAEHLPPGSLNVVCGDRDAGRALVAHPVPAMVAITGSVRGPGARWRQPPARRSSASTSSWAARRRYSSSATRIPA